jgi:hypothetical protein
MHTASRASTAATHVMNRLRITSCPEPGCGLPTEIGDGAVLASTDGPIMHVRTVCLTGHWLFLPLETVIS